MKGTAVSEDVQRLCREIAPFAEQDTLEQLRVQRRFHRLRVCIGNVNDTLCPNAECLYPA